MSTYILLTRKVLIMPAADDILILILYFSEEMRLGISCESSPWQMIHMKCQVLFSLNIMKTRPYNYIENFTSKN